MVDQSYVQWDNFNTLILNLNYFYLHLSLCAITFISFSRFLFAAYLVWNFCGIQTILSYDLKMGYKDFKPIAKSLAVLMIQKWFLSN